MGWHEWRSGSGHRERVRFHRTTGKPIAGGGGREGGGVALGDGVKPLSDEEDGQEGEE